jgi:5-methylcytosine-specific restriction protein B
LEGANVVRKTGSQLPFAPAKLIQEFSSSVTASGLLFSHQLIQRFVASLCTKAFVICSGLSGSGKTKLAQAFVQWICDKEEEGEENDQYCIIPVGADWTNREPLLGYPNALTANQYVKPENGVLDLITRAMLNRTKPYFLILDEMNLSHVERYFADFLSTMESGNTIPLHSIEDESHGIPQHLTLPKNLFIIGTVNIDETTYMFSPKVLDRANTIEFRLTEKDLETYIDANTPLNLNLVKGQGASMGEGFVEMATGGTTDNILLDSKQDLRVFFAELKKAGAEFGYRTTNEMGRLMSMLKTLGESDRGLLLDIAIMQKLLPKLHGSRSKLTKVLPVLGGFCLTDRTKVKEAYLDKFVLNTISDIDLKADSNIKYPISFEKICRMYKNAIDNGFASYAEA